MAAIQGLIILLAFATACIVVAGTLALICRMTRPYRQTYASALALRLPACPADIGLESVEQTVTFADRTTTPVWIVDGDGPADTTIVISHGFSVSRYQALEHVKLFKQWASKLVVYDLRAHGESTARRAGLGVVEAADLIELIHQLDLPERIVLYGQSMGAAVSITAAGRLPEDLRERVKAVIAEAPFRTLVEPIAARRRRHRYPVFPFVPLAWFWMALPLRKYRPFDRVKDAARLRCPLLVLHGKLDWLCSFESAKQIVDAAPHGTIVGFDKGEHLDLVELYPDQYLEAIGRFLDDVRKADGVENAGSCPTD